MHWYRFTMFALCFLSSGLVGAEVKETQVVRVFGRDNDTQELRIAHPITGEKLNYRIESVLRGKAMPFYYSEDNYIKLTLEGDAKDKRIVDFTAYNPTAIERMDNTYIFKSIENDAAGTKKNLRVQLTRFEYPFEAVLPLTPDNQWMIERVDQFKPGTPVTAIFKRNDKNPLLTDLDYARPCIRAVYIKSGDATIDGKRFAGATFDIDGQEKVLVYPPAGQKARPSDAEALSFLRKVKKGQSLFLTFDSSRPDVIRSAEHNVTIRQIDENSYRLEAAGVELHTYIDDRGFPHVRIEPFPVSDADHNLLTGLYYRRSYGHVDPATGQAIARKDELITDAEKIQMLSRMLNTFANREEPRKDAQQLTAQLQQLVAVNRMDKRKLETALYDAALQLSLKYAPQSVEAYRDARRTLDTDVTKLESLGKSLRDKGIWRQ